MKTVKIKYKDYEFPSNPSSIEISSKRRLGITPVFSKKSVTESICVSPAVITAKGTLYCDNAVGECERINELLKQNGSGMLRCPGVYPMKAFMSDFVYKIESDTNAVKYSITFTQDCDNSHSDEVLFSYTIAKDGENAFDIAHRCLVTVDDIMKLNEFRSPFDIKEGERVKIR